ncbi:spermidine synthase [Pseudohongiella nitratireducens]|uniref:spermidine synthase n=1 Tax=Pseudohongiella nitratireducens TaxID=1768907 RepID=UPI00240A1247|nr:fused MFS/spermidine synthase [Pseudohongiella nitratireducens]MDF1622949.1 fused MFS/spermidine synthase [Pseudohongiella nitratireducens]|tara:strand:- start:5143 stop:6036 length:894 start_codon:yes stop_codon:yes gene_type:complete
MRFATWLISLLLVTTGTQQASAQRNVVHEERSQYRDIVVTEFNGQRCMLFNVVRGDMNQTCMDLSDPERLIFTYTKMSFAGLLFNPQPERILIAGLGGGTIPMTLRELYPDAEMDVVEIDPAVVTVAKDWFNYQEDAKHEVHVVDARVFIKRAGLRGEKYDFIMLDAFSGEYIPEHLLSREFLQEVKTLLTDDGILVANTFSSSRLYDHESVTYRDVFGPFYNFKLPDSGNRIILATPGDTLPHVGDLRAPARDLYDRLEPYGINILEFPPRLTDEPDWDTEARVLTDQYSPANLLN